MTTLHAFGCSITQGFALPDIVKPITDEQGNPLSKQQLEALGIHVNWEDIHLYKPSDYAWPNVLGKQLGMAVQNHARRGACFQQIARQCAVAAKDIKPDDIVIVMWTYLSRVSIQWPARTTVPFCNMIDPNWGWRSMVVGFNKFFGLSQSNKHTEDKDKHIHEYIEKSAKTVYLDPMSIYDRYYNNLVLQQMTDGFLRATGARIIHLSVEHDPYREQLERARDELDQSLREPYKIPHPDDWYTLDVDHLSSIIIHDPRIPPAENDMHPSVTHHRNFAEHVYELYFQDRPIA